MAATHFDLVSHWHLPAPVETVWAALAEPETWPQWWPYVKAVWPLRNASAGGDSAVKRIRWATRLPYEFVIEVELLESLKPERIRGRSTGQLQGEGIWLLRPSPVMGAQAWTDVTYVWRVQLTQPWMRWTAPLFKPLFRWNHGEVMRAGEEGLARYLAQR